MHFSDFEAVAEEIIREVEKGLACVDGQEVSTIVEAILSAGQVFCVGTGRSGAIMQAFCIRLNHLGLKAFYIGNIACPPATKADLIIACSGSGKTTSVLSIVQKAKQIGLRICLITSQTDQESTVLTDDILHIEAPNELINMDNGLSKQPMRTLFEQIVFFVCEAMVAMLQERLHISEVDMAHRHANLE